VLDLFLSWGWRPILSPKCGVFIFTKGWWTESIKYLIAISHSRQAPSTQRFPYFSSCVTAIPALAVTGPVIYPLHHFHLSFAAGHGTQCPAAAWGWGGGIHLVCASGNTGASVTSDIPAESNLTGKPMRVYWNEVCYIFISNGINGLWYDRASNMNKHTVHNHSSFAWYISGFPNIYNY
jgi:hypothetical protein